MEEITISSRIADSTIKGFLYQFNLTLKKLLESPVDCEVQVEGIVEDIDIISENGITAIQCKYHESQEIFNLSAIYKPVLQMLKNYSKNPDANILYILYAFFPSMPTGPKKLTEDEISEILNTTNLDYVSNYVAYIKPCKDSDIIKLLEKTSKTLEDKKKIKKYYTENNITIGCDIDKFFDGKFKFIIGQSYLEIQEIVKELMVKETFSEIDVEEIFYPNAIQKIAEISTKADNNERLIKKLVFIDELQATKKTAITRWTKELGDYRKLLKIRQKQLGANLNRNIRKRYFIFEPNNIENFNEDIVVFLKDFTDVYCHKAKLHNPAIFCINSYTKEDIDEIITRLYSKGITVENGYRGNSFFKEAFIKEPERKVTQNWMQFVLRIGHGMEDIYNVINENKPDDIFIIGKDIPSFLDLRDVNVEILDIANFEELRYLLKIETEVG